MNIRDWWCLLGVHPSPFAPHSDGRNGPPFKPGSWGGVDWVIRSHLDVMEPISLAPDERHLEAVTGWGSNDGWVRIYRYQVNSWPTTPPARRPAHPMQQDHTVPGAQPFVQDCHR